MRKILLISILTISLLLLTSCNIGEIEISDTIVAPKNESIPIYGKWIIEDYKAPSNDEEDEEIIKSYLGKEAIFHGDFVALGDDYCEEPIFKTKNVVASAYILYQYKTNPDFLNIDKDEIQIISIMSKDQFFYEFIKESEDRIIVNIEGIFFYLKLVSEELKDEDIAEFFYKEKTMFRMDSLTDSQSTNSSLLIGLKSLDLDERYEKKEKWNYRTILIRSYDEEVVGLYEMEDIFLPRKTGFWKVNVHREENDDKVNDKILAYPLKKNKDLDRQDTDKTDKGEEKEVEENTLKNILYVGNDYISIEKVNYLNKGERLLELYLIDNIGKGNPIKISDVAGEAGQTSFLDEGNKVILTEDNKYRYSSIDLRPNEESFGLFRRNGHWIYKGRVNFIQDGNYSYKNFNIRAIPSKEVVHYDELSIPWNAIKSRVPEAIDAFTSPAEDIAVVVTHNSMMIYPIDGGGIGYEPIAKIKLEAAEKIIMAEWAVGRYPVMWEEEFLRNEAIPIEDLK